MLSLDELRARYESTPIANLLDLWSRSGRTAGVESMLRAVLVARGVPGDRLDELAGARAQPAPVEPMSTTRGPRHVSSGARRSPNPATTHPQRQAAFAVFAVVLFAELALAWGALPAIDAKAFHDFMLVSMGLAYIPLVLALAAIVVVIAVFALVAWLAARIFLAMVRD